MPVSAARSAIGGRPPLGFGERVGNNGSMRDHNSSESSGFAMSRSSLNTRKVTETDYFYL